MYSLLLSHLCLPPSIFLIHPPYFLFPPSFSPTFYPSLLSPSPFAPTYRSFSLEHISHLLSFLLYLSPSLLLSFILLCLFLHCFTSILIFVPVSSSSPNIPLFSFLLPQTFPLFCLPNSLPSFLLLLPLPSSSHFLPTTCQKS